MRQIFFWGLLMIFVSNCVNDDNDYSTIDAIRRIVNETDYHLDIIAYEGLDTFQFSIAPHSTFDIEGTCGQGHFDSKYCYLGWYFLAYGEILFNNERILQFELSNPLDCGQKAFNGSVWSNCGYMMIENTETLQIFEYKITNVDYNNAEIL